MFRRCCCPFRNFPSLNSEQHHVDFAYPSSSCPCIIQLVCTVPGLAWPGPVISTAGNLLSTLSQTISFAISLHSSQLTAHSSQLTAHGDKPVSSAPKPFIMPPLFLSRVINEADSQDWFRVTMSLSDDYSLKQCNINSPQYTTPYPCAIPCKCVPLIVFSHSYSISTISYRNIPLTWYRNLGDQIDVQKSASSPSVMAWVLALSPSSAWLHSHSSHE
ncbi:uncharacterized protein F4817DRAFT_241536 [Daldinia loculata]|uniref:uncharacterized protein n=1 Tax=Daldinia loculata TaxID=103429 RepID=UPI0020C56D07|nr:uncharacterized protein F4817DRAFT_241536 [Daldinia loculata]KAI1650766.1 hypothetical protein F4817DRAFT_241536 [Daldinia loculata]